MPKISRNPKRETVIEDLAETLSPSDGVFIILDLPRPWVANGVPLPGWQAGGTRRMILLQWDSIDGGPP